jgi:pimeloyl-ACP methyl ester carboxylesterase
MTGAQPAAPDPLWATTTGIPGATHVVLVHGSLDRSAGMTKLGRRLEDRLRVTRFDRRGYGRSVPHAGPFGIDQQVDDLVRVIDSAPEAPLPSVVFGHSYGGNVALATAERHPALVAGVVVYETPLAWLDWWPVATAGGDARAWEHDPEGAAERFMRRLIGDARWERLPDATREARRAEGVALVAELGDLSRAAPWSPDRIEVPVVAMRGEHGPAHHEQGMRALAAWFGTGLVTIPGAHHFGPNTHPDDVAAVVADFAARVVTRAGAE